MSEYKSDDFTIVASTAIDMQRQIAFIQYGERLYYPKERLEQIEKENAELKAKLEKAKDALRFYSDSTDDGLDWDRVNNPSCIQDKGKLARQALAELEST